MMLPAGARSRLHRKMESYAHRRTLATGYAIQRRFFTRLCCTTGGVFFPMQDHLIRTDVTVIGGGLAGMASAIHLAKAGLTVACIGTCAAYSGHLLEDRYASRAGRRSGRRRSRGRLSRTVCRPRCTVAVYARDALGGSRQSFWPRYRLSCRSYSCRLLYFTDQGTPRSLKRLRGALHR